MATFAQCPCNYCKSLAKVLFALVVVVSASCCRHIEAFQRTVNQMKLSVTTTPMLNPPTTTTDTMMNMDNTTRAQTSPEVDNSLYHRRHVFQTVLAHSSSAGLAITMASNPGAAMAASKPLSPKPLSPQQTLEDARTQLDLAVQASSVQAWSDAADIIRDEILDDNTLEKAFQEAVIACNSSSTSSSLGPSLKEYQSTCIVGIKKIRNILLSSSSSQQSKTSSLATEDAMAVMRYGTSARVALDLFLEAIKEQ